MAVHIYGRFPFPSPGLAHASLSIPPRLISFQPSPVSFTDKFTQQNMEKQNSEFIHPSMHSFFYSTYLLRPSNVLNSKKMTKKKVKKYIYHENIRVNEKGVPGWLS